MNFTEQADALVERIQQVCEPQARYRVLWVVGPPRSGKTILCREVCRQLGWRYINFTLDPGYLDSLIGQEKIYRPEDFWHALPTWCTTCPNEGLVLDEIEPLLGLWNFQEQDIFFKKISWTTRLERGVVIVSRLRDGRDMAELVPNKTHVFELI